MKIKSFSSLSLETSVGLVSFCWWLSLPHILLYALTVAIVECMNYTLDMHHVPQLSYHWHLLLSVMGNVRLKRCSTPMSAINAMAEIGNGRHLFRNRTSNHSLILRLELEDSKIFSEKIPDNWFSIVCQKLNQHLMIWSIYCNYRTCFAFHS